MLTYAQRGRRIRVVRPPTTAEAKGTLVATIDIRTFEVRVPEGTEVSQEERQEIAASAQELKAADPQKWAATLGFSAAVSNALKFYVEKGTALDKQLIWRTVRQAAKALRKADAPTAKGND